MSTSVNMPAVASKHYTFCKKCETDRYHTVVAHTNETTSKMKCEVCGKTLNLNFSSDEKKKKAATQRLAGAAAARKAQSENARRSQHQQEYESFMAKSEAPVAKYNMREKFILDSKLDHPKFGMGYVKQVQPDKIEVIFSDEVRLLIHNRQ